MIGLNWSKKIASYFTGNGFIYVVSDEYNLLGQSTIQDILSRQNCTLHFYEDPVIFREYYESEFRHLHRTERSSLLIVISNSQFTRVPYDVYEQAVCVTLSFNKLFPNLEPSIVRQCPGWMYELIYIAQHSIAQGLNSLETTDFLLNDVCGIHASRIYTETDLVKSGLFYYERFDEGLPRFLFERLERLLTLPTKQLSPASITIFQSKKEFHHFLNTKWQQYIHHFVHQANKQVAESYESYTFNLFHDPYVQRYIDTAVEPVEVPNDIRFEQWMLPGLLIQEEKISIEHSPFKEEYTSFERNDWLCFANELGLLQQQHLKEGKYHESFQTNVAKANEAFKRWMFENFQQLRSLPVVPKPKMVHQIPHYLARQADQKIALVVLDGMSFTQWHLIKDYLHSPAWHFEEDAVFAWVPSVTSVSRQALFSGHEPRFFANTITSTHKEKALWTAFWEEQGFSKQNIAFEKSLGLSAYNQQQLAYQFSPAIRIYGAVIDVIDQFMHGAAQGIQTVQSELNTWLHSQYLTSFIGDLMTAGFQVYLTADHGNVECIGRGRISQGVTVESKGERARIYSSLNIRNHTANEQQDTMIWDDTSLPNDYHVLLAENNGAFVPNHQKIVTHGGIHIEEVIVPFIKVSR
ncbi:BREX-3 system phosphatase PglZ [Sporosarcina highlanderae]|uniref:BREX-3 system phosphatase PglZ n=1 Tax=Sporosarcina highlanderae TaxID=3035916 RepID=A0ABT8JT81_9BACL|nr:BREX-3 system phosphatase PglZ [Sporosarcina highlanderae]MDN4608202.1 BREX-3 system phosphatase PglZ [Sporosarcina highlanderae]